MALSFITGSFPKSVQIGGRDYEIRWDNRTGMQFDIIRDSEDKDETKIMKLLQLYYPVIPENLKEAIDKMLWFYRCGEAEEEEAKETQRYQRRTSKEPAYSFEQDVPYIYAAFKEQYGIDLTEEDDMHWWKFMALFESLNEDTKMSKIMYYRKASTSGMSKDRRAFINEMKKLYRIKGSKKKMTLEDRNQKWRQYIADRQKEIH